MSDHTEWDELAAGYALNALTPDEESAFTAHLETCEACQAAVDDHVFVAAQLGAIAMSDVQLETPSWSSIRSSVVDAPQDAGSDVNRMPASVADVVDLSDRRRRYATSRRVLAAAAAVVVIAGGGIVAWRAQSGGDTTARCGTTAGCHTVALASASGARAASLTVQGDVITMLPTGMKPAPTGSEYVLWQLPADGRPIAVKVFTATGKGVVAKATTGVAYADTTAFAVSEERSGPVPAKPTTPLLASGTAT
jgi:anti-sigma-K factor RskA